MYHSILRVHIGGAQFLKLPCTVGVGAVVLELCDSFLCASAGEASTWSGVSQNCSGPWGRKGLYRDPRGSILRIMQGMTLRYLKK